MIDIPPKVKLQYIHVHKLLVFSPSPLTNYKGNVIKNLSITYNTRIMKNFNSIKYTTSKIHGHVYLFKKFYIQPMKGKRNGRKQVIIKIKKKIQN